MKNDNTVKENINNKQKEGVSNKEDITSTNKFDMLVNEDGQTEEDKEWQARLGSGGRHQDLSNTK